MEWTSMKRNLLITGVVFLFAFNVAVAQTGTSAIGGTVTDQQGKGVPGAKVTITNVATNATRSAVSTNAGAYVFDLITPGDYRLEVEARGFNKTVFDKVRAQIGKQTESNVQLSLGAVSQVVEVSASGTRHSQARTPAVMKRRLSTSWSMVWGSK